MIYILACRRSCAEYQARTRNLNPSKWRYVTSPSVLRATRGARIIQCNNWGANFNGYDYTRIVKLLESRAAIVDGELYREHRRRAP